MQQLLVDRRPSGWTPFLLLHLPNLGVYEVLDFCPFDLCTTIRAMGMPISVRMTASIQYARAKGVFPVGHLGVV